MTWDMSVSTEIAVMFSGYSWHADELQEAYNDRRARQLAQGAEYRSDPLRRKLAVERAVAWKKANPERARAHQRSASKRERERAKSDPVLREKLRARGAKAQRQKFERDPEKVRKWWRDNQRAMRDRKRAALGLPPADPRRIGRPRIVAVPRDPLAAAHAELRRRLSAKAVSP